MATVRAKLRASSVAGKAGTVYYQVIHRRKVLQIATGIHLHKEDWDYEKGQALDASGTLVAVYSKIAGDLESIRHIIHELDASCSPYTADMVVERFKQPQLHLSFVAYMEEQIRLKQAAGKLGTASNYRHVCDSFSLFLGSVELSVASVNEHVIGRYNAFLVNRGLRRNSISFYMRILRSVYNKAVRQGLAVQNAPFVDVYTGIDRTRKRAVDESVVRSLYRLDLSHNARQEQARDFFIFSYCTRGMAFVDMAYLKKTDIRGGYICYARRKTHRQMQVRIDHHVRKILEKYAHIPTAYVFPVIQSDEPQEAYAQYRRGINEYNRVLGILERKLQGEHHLTSYTARHSWATNAYRQHQQPVSVVSAGLGHSMERTTQIYLSELENTVIDKANEDVTSALDE